MYCRKTGSIYAGCRIVENLNFAEAYSRNCSTVFVPSFNSISVYYSSKAPICFSPFLVQVRSSDPSVWLLIWGIYKCLTDRLTARKEKFVFSFINCLSEEIGAAMQANLTVINYVEFFCLYWYVLYLHIYAALKWIPSTRHILSLNTTSIHAIR